LNPDHYDPPVLPIWLIFLLVLVAVAAILCAATIVLMAWSLTHPPRMTDGRAMAIFRRLSPADLGLAFEETRFQVRETSGRALKIAAWWIPNPGAEGRCAVLIHGYADAKVGVIAWGPVWHSLGFNLLVPDLRAHGESDGAVSTAGHLERQDLIQVIHELRAELPAETKTIVLFGVSLGAAVAAGLGAECPDVAAVVLESPYADFRRAAMAHMDRLGAPGRVLQRPALRLSEWLTGSDYDALAPVALIPRLRCPTLIVEAEDDPFLSPEDRAALADAARAAPSAEIWTAEGAEHLMAMHAEPGAYREKLAAFLRSCAIREFSTHANVLPPAGIEQVDR